MGGDLLYSLGPGIVWHFYCSSILSSIQSFQMSHWICLGLAFIICPEPRFSINVTVQGSEMYLYKISFYCLNTNCLFVWSRSEITTETKVNYHAQSESQRVNIVSQIFSQIVNWLSQCCVATLKRVCEASAFRAWRFFRTDLNICQRRWQGGNSSSYKIYLHGSRSNSGSYVI